MFIQWKYSSIFLIYIKVGSFIYYFRKLHECSFQLKYNRRLKIIFFFSYDAFKRKVYNGYLRFIWSEIMPSTFSAIYSITLIRNFLRFPSKINRGIVLSYHYVSMIKTNIKTAYYRST
jgi:hypothetical protein